MINLQRRADRRVRMLRALRMQGIDCKIVAAVDGKYVVFLLFPKQPVTLGVYVWKRLCHRDVPWLQTNLIRDRSWNLYPQNLHAVEVA